MTWVSTPSRQTPPFPPPSTRSISRPRNVAPTFLAVALSSSPPRRRLPPGRHRGAAGAQRSASRGQSFPLGRAACTSGSWRSASARENVVRRPRPGAPLRGRPPAAPLRPLRGCAQAQRHEGPPASRAGAALRGGPRSRTVSDCLLRGGRRDFGRETDAQWSMATKKILCY